MSQLDLFAIPTSALVTIRHHESVDDDSKPPTDAERKAEEYAAILESEGMDPDAAYLRASAAYGLTRRRPAARVAISREFQKAAAHHYGSGRPGAK